MDATQIKPSRLEDARGLWNYLKNDALFPGERAYFIKERILEDLRAEGAGYEALDPSGKTSAAAMQKALNEVTARREISDARGEWGLLLSGALRSGERATFIKDRIIEHLSAANASLAALDPAGKTSAADIEKRMDRITAKLEIAGANEQWAALSAGALRPGERAKYIRDGILERLRAAGADVSALEPKISSEMLDKFTARQEIKDALARAADGSPRQYVTERLKAAAELDPAWKTSAPDMETALKLVAARLQALDAHTLADGGGIGGAEQVTAASGPPPRASTGARRPASPAYPASH